MVLSTIGLAQPGKIMRGFKAEECKRHLHQLHVCMPSKEGHTRLLYRMSLDFWGWAKHVPFVDKLWKQVCCMGLERKIWCICLPVNPVLWILSKNGFCC
jgi:chlorophyllide a oxygenase